MVTSWRGFEGADDAFDADPGGLLEVAGYSQRGYDHGQVSLDLDCWVFFGQCLFCASGCLLQVQELAFDLVGSAIP